MTELVKYAEILELGLVPVFYQDNLETAKKIVQACVDGGQKVVEFTNRGDFAYQVFAELAKWVNTQFKDIIIGVGSVIDPVTAVLYINSGANFVVGPVLEEEVNMRKRNMRNYEAKGKENSDENYLRNSKILEEIGEKDRAQGVNLIIDNLITGKRNNYRWSWYKNHLRKY
jgi:hypothetical protein